MGNEENMQQEQHRQTPPAGSSSTISPLFLGIDLSTQSITVAFIEASSHTTVFLDSLNFDETFPKYDTTAGMKPCKNGKVTSPVQMWLEGLDKLLRRQDKALMARVKAVSGSAQQHGSVYWNADGLQALMSMNPEDSLAVNLYGGFALEDCPIWADSSTQTECDAIENAMGGPGRVAAVTGSRAYCRFTGPQIAKVARRNPMVYGHTTRVSLVSSFLTSLLRGRPAPIEASDASGMNLMNVRTLEWSEELLEATAPSLLQRLGPIAKPWEPLGPVSPYCATRYGLPADALVIPVTGDNNCSIVGMGLTPPSAAAASSSSASGGTLMVSLGTSDTLVGLTNNPRPSCEGHVMVSPRGPEEWFAMLCYKNGALAREEVRNRVCGGDWEKFDALLRASPPGNEGNFGLFLVMEEIVPICNAKGIFRVNAREEAVTEFAEAAHEVRAVVEGRFLSMKVNAQKLGLPTAPTCILATGGGSTNEGIMQVLADVFNADVFVADTSDSAAVGAALRAEHGLACRRNGHWVTFQSGEPQGLRRVATPQSKAVEVYNEELLGRFAAFERSIAVQAQERKV